MPAQAPSPTRIQLYQFGAAILLLSAMFGTFISWLAYGLLCDENCTGRSWELVWQLVIAVAGLATALGMTYFTLQHRWRAAAVALSISLCLYAAWAVVLDAATHGWGYGHVPF